MGILEVSLYSWRKKAPIQGKATSGKNLSFGEDTKRKVGE